MTTIELIKILQDNEKGGISHKPRNISLYINGRYMPDPQISLSSTGDGVCGPEIDLDIEGDWFEQIPSVAPQPKTGYISIDVNKLAKEVAEKALEITYEGKTIREWAEILVKQPPCEDCISREEVRGVLGNDTR